MKNLKDFLVMESVPKKMSNEAQNTFNELTKVFKLHRDKNKEGIFDAEDDPYYQAWAYDAEVKNNKYELLNDYIIQLSIDPVSGEFSIWQDNGIALSNYDGKWDVVDDYGENRNKQWMNPLKGSFDIDGLFKMVEDWDANN